MNKLYSFCLIIISLLLPYTAAADRITYTESFNSFDDSKISFTTTYRYYATWADWTVMHGNVSSGKDVTGVMGSYAFVLQATNTSSATLTNTKILAVDSISFAIAVNNTDAKYSVAYSEDSVNWTNLVTDAKLVNKIKNTCHLSLPERKDIYLRFTLQKTSLSSLTYQCYIDDVTFFSTTEPSEVSAAAVYTTSSMGVESEASELLHITNPTLMSGTLTIADVSGSESGQFAATIHSATATRNGLHATVRIRYTPAAANLTESGTMRATINGLNTDFSVYGRSLPDSFIVVSEQGSQWSALAHDRMADGKEGYAVALDDENNPTLATLATDSSRFAACEWQRPSWQWATHDNITYSLYDNNADGYITLNAHHEWALSPTPTQTLRLLPYRSVVQHAELMPTEWNEHGLQFIVPSSRGLPVYDSLHIEYDGVRYRQLSPLGATSNGLYTLTIPSLELSSGGTIRMKWYKANHIVALTDLTSPLRVADISDLQSIATSRLQGTDILVQSGEPLTLDSDIEFRDLTIEAGATLRLTGSTLRVRHIRLEGGYTSQNETEVYDVPRLIIDDASLIASQDTLHYVLRINADHYYPLAVPFAAKIADLRYLSLPDEPLTSLIGTAVNICTYDGEARGAGDETTTKYWQPVASNTTLQPSQGYIITAKRLRNEPYACLRFAMKVDSGWLTMGEQATIEQNETELSRNTVDVGAWGVGSSISAGEQGWNAVANPYLAPLSGEDYELQLDEGNVRYVTIPSYMMDDYTQLPADEATLLPMQSFFVQVAETGTMSLVSALRHSIPARYAAPREQAAYIEVVGNGQTDRIGLLIDDTYTPQYDFNADLKKELGQSSTLRAYLQYADQPFAFLALPDTTGTKPLPIVVRCPADGEYMFRLHERSHTSSIQAIYLTDNLLQTKVDLLKESYRFSSTSSLISDRFVLQAVINEVPTSIEEMDTDSCMWQKELRNGSLYLRKGEQRYDILGR